MWKTATILAVVLSIPTLAYSATLVVPDDCPTIQGAIDAAVAGDTVLVKPGTYYENIDFLGKAITVRSEQGPRDTCIDGSGVDTVVTFDKGEPPDAVIEGFCITNGRGSGTGPLTNGGGGITCDSSSPTIKNNIIMKNFSFYDGGGVFCTFASAATIVGNVVRDNSAKGGAGVYCHRSAPLIMGNLIHGNTVGGNGCGVYCNDYASPLVVNNLIFDNMAFAKGGGLFSNKSSPLILNCTFVGNQDPQGGGIMCQYDSSLVIINTILWNDTPPELWIGLDSGDESQASLSHCDIDGGLSSVHVEPASSLNWGAGMIDADPLFVDLSGRDLHLIHPSPCRDAGLHAVLPVTDFEGDPRVAGFAADIGADEFYTHLYVTGDMTPGGMIQGKLVGLPGTTPVAMFFGSGVLSNPFTTPWGNCLLQPPWLLVELMPIPADGVMVLPATLPMSPPAPYNVPMQALIGLQPDSLSNLCVLQVR